MAAFIWSFLLQYLATWKDRNTWPSNKIYTDDGQDTSKGQQIWGLHEAEWLYRTIALHMWCSNVTATRCWNQLVYEGSPNCNEDSSCPKQTTLKESRIVPKALQDCTCHSETSSTPRYQLLYSFIVLCVSHVLSITPEQKWLFEIVPYLKINHWCYSWLFMVLWRWYWLVRGVEGWYRFLLCFIYLESQNLNWGIM